MTRKEWRINWQGRGGLRILAREMLTRATMSMQTPIVDDKVLKCEETGQMMLMQMLMIDDERPAPEVTR